MLTYLHVKNFALIHELTIEFGPGMTVLTGETGAGKSILIGSMNAISGNKLDKSIIRRGADYAFVEMQFELDESVLNHFTSSYGIEPAEHGTLVLSRKYNTSGRSIYRINGETVTSQVMAEVFDRAIDIHSQHEHQSLLSPRSHLNLLDQYLGDQVTTTKKALRKVYGQYMDYMKQLNEDHLDDEHRLREMDFLRFEIHELDAANLEPGEDQRLQSSFKLLSNSKKIEEALAHADALLRDDHSLGITDLISSISGEFQRIRHLDDGLSDLAKELEQIESMVFDFGRNLDRFRDNLETDHESLETISERLHVINTLKQKYGDTMDMMLQALEAKQRKLEHLENYEANIHRMRREIVAFETEIRELSATLHGVRVKGAKKMSVEIESVLKDLNFNNNQVEVAVTPVEQFSAEGMDKVAILISTNRNEPVQPLNRIASGGELSRVMLALKSVFAELDQLDTMVFDEIDAGISGRTAQMVAEKMALLSKKRQLIVITHLPQIAAMADAHYLIKKDEVGDRVETHIDPLEFEAVHEELSRLIGGAVITGATMQAAKEMKEQAEALKK